jgi:malonyl-CoA/methylmalonyl-CoA synthetase
MNNLYHHIEDATPARIDRAVLTTDRSRIVTWGELHARTASYANLLLDCGLQPGDRVAAQVEKSPESLFLYLACLRAGLVYLPLNTAYRRSELAYFLGDAQPRAVVGRPNSVSELGALAPGAHLFSLDDAGNGTLRAAAASQPESFETRAVASDDLATIIYTSGTTGRSKGAMVTHGNLVSNAQALVQCWGFRSADVLLHALPVFHVHGLFVANHCVLLSGASMLWHAKFDAKRVLEDLARATVLMGVPTFYTRLLAEPGFDRAVADHVRLFVSGSAPLLLETFEVFERRTGQRILERYGMSEAGMITSNPLSGERRGGTVGLPLPGVSVRVADEQDRPLPVGEAGGIQIKGPNVFKGYWRMPDKTREEFTADGWFRTGDVGRFDRDGYLAIVGRAKDLIISGGYNVYPKEIELAIDAISGVAESAAVGLPHPDLGEGVSAAVVLKPGVHLTEVDIIGRLRGELAGYKVPKRVFIVSELPRNAMGKVQKNVLRDQFRSTFTG